MAGIGTGSNPISVLNSFYRNVEYSFKDPVGPPHCRVFFCSVTVEGSVFTGHGSSKKSAKQAAAHSALLQLNNMRLRLSYGTSDGKREWKGCVLEHGVTVLLLDARCEGRGVECDLSAAILSGTRHGFAAEDQFYRRYSTMVLSISLRTVRYFNLRRLDYL